MITRPQNDRSWTEREYIYQMRHNISADQSGDSVTITWGQVLSGPETDRVYRSDGSLASRVTGDIVTRLDARELSYSGIFDGGEGEFVATDENGNSVRALVTRSRLRLEFENHADLYYPFVRSFYDYSSGVQESTPFRDHFTSDPYVIEFNR